MRENGNGKVRVSSEVNRAERWEPAPLFPLLGQDSCPLAGVRGGESKQPRASEMNAHINHTAPDVHYVQREFMHGEPVR